MNLRLELSTGRIAWTQFSCRVESVQATDPTELVRRPVISLAALFMTAAASVSIQARSRPHRAAATMMSGSRAKGWSRFMFTAAWLAIVLCLTQPTVATSKVDFESEIAPIFSQHCLRCHSPGNKKGDISLATSEDLRHNAYVVSGDPASSYLIELIRGVDGEPPQMPKQGAAVSADQVALIERWISEGASWPQDVIVRERARTDASWWSLQPLLSAPSPETGDRPAQQPENSIDRFVDARLAKHGLTVNPAADRRTLIRRATYDLLGLPPTPEQVEAFVNNPDPAAYEQLIDRLLQSPHYGERWGRHWLDVVRFGESNGYERNFIINDLWPFRDYVISAINSDRPFDQLIREHLAGDVFGKDQPKVEVGSAFLVAGPFDDVGNQDVVQAAQIRANTIDEIIRATGGAFLGLTIGCARCHDHKFDPILQRDYYSWYATFSAVRHGRRVVATAKEKSALAARREPLEARRDQLVQQREALRETILTRALTQSARYEGTWTRERCDPRGTEESFAAVEVNYIRLISEGRRDAPQDDRRFDIDEFEVWSAEDRPRNVALASNGATASGASREIEDFPGAYGPHLAIDGKTGARFLGRAGSLTIKLPAQTLINRVFFSTARGEETPDQPQFQALAEYRIEISQDGTHWIEVANSHDRQPLNEAHRTHRLIKLETTQTEGQQFAELARQLAAVRQDLAQIPELPSVWVGTRAPEDATGPFHVFVGGNPQLPGERVLPTSLGALSTVFPAYELAADEPEGNRRQSLADWIVHPQNPLTPRVLANRLWHYHFGTGIVDTPNDFGYMGTRPTHPELLDWLAKQIHRHSWRLKPLHKLIMMSKTYRQSSEFQAAAAKIDGDARLLWRFPPRRLSAEEIRDTMLSVAGKLDTRMGGPGFRLYEFLQDNVATYKPLDRHGPETYRRAVYHQNARASVLDLMTDFDQPDCAFSAPKRSQTTTPLQALTMLNHSFTIEMARRLAERLQRDVGDDVNHQIIRAFQLCFSRHPTETETSRCAALIEANGMPALCRVLLNTSELIYLH